MITIDDMHVGREMLCLNDDDSRPHRSWQGKVMDVVSIYDDGVCLRLIEGGKVQYHDMAIDTLNGKSHLGLKMVFVDELQEKDIFIYKMTGKVPCITEK